MLLLPGAEAQLSPSKLPQIILHAMPLAWQDKFAYASKTTQNSAKIELQDYMQRQSDKDPPKPNYIPTKDFQSRDSNSQGPHSNRDSHQPNNSPSPLPGH